ncbi:MAG: hypothetical protein ACLFQV_01290 [Vulcanimicrobiota bacterium]
MNYKKLLLIFISILLLLSGLSLAAVRNTGEQQDDFWDDDFDTPTPKVTSTRKERPRRSQRSGVIEIEKKDEKENEKKNKEEVKVLTPIPKNTASRNRGSFLLFALVGLVLIIGVLGIYQLGKNREHDF